MIVVGVRLQISWFKRSPQLDEVSVSEKTSMHSNRECWSIKCSKSGDFKSLVERHGHRLDPRMILSSLCTEIVWQLSLLGPSPWQYPLFSANLCGLLSSRPELCSCAPMQRMCACAYSVLKPCSYPYMHTLLMTKCWWCTFMILRTQSHDTYVALDTSMKKKYPVHAKLKYRACISWNDLSCAACIENLLHSKIMPPMVTAIMGSKNSIVVEVEKEGRGGGARRSNSTKEKNCWSKRWLSRVKNNSHKDWKGNKMEEEINQKKRERERQFSLLGFSVSWTWMRKYYRQVGKGANLLSVQGRSSIPTLDWTSHT